MEETRSGELQNEPEKTTLDLEGENSTEAFPVQDEGAESGNQEKDECTSEIKENNHNIMHEDLGHEGETLDEDEGQEVAEQEALSQEDEITSRIQKYLTTDDNDDVDDDDKDQVFGNDLDFRSRNVLYEKGVQFKRRGKNQLALHCFLGCLKGLEPGCQFIHIPECLHNLAEIYSSEDDYENAIQFIQAEKIYYETALIAVGDDDEIAAKEFEFLTSGILSSEQTDATNNIPTIVDPDATDPDALRANEYEKLAIMCLGGEKLQLALEYSGKATKIRQAVYGERHPITLKSLDLFTNFYAEMGKLQYAAAMEKYVQSQKAAEEEKTVETKKPVETKDLPQAAQEQVIDQEQVIEQEQQQSPDSQQQGAPNDQETSEFSVTRKEALFIYFVITLVATLLLVYCCSNWVRKDFPSTYSYVIRRLKFLYYSYIESPLSSNKYF